MSCLRTKLMFIVLGCALIMSLAGGNSVKAEAASTVTISSGGTVNKSVSASGDTITVNLTGAYTSTKLQGKPSWVSSSGSGSKFTLSVSSNTSTSSRSGSVVFQDGSKVWTLKISQSAAAPKTYVVALNSQGGGTYPNQNVQAGGHPNLPTPSKTGNTFKGWYTSASGGTKVDGNYTVNSNVTLYAQWTINTYTVTFNGNGGNSSTRSVTHGSTLGTLPSSSRTGYTFKGWYTSASGGSKISTSTTITGSVTYYAQWNVNTYTVAFDSQGGGSYASINVTHGGHPSLPTPYKSGSTFLGWYTAASGGTKVDGNYTVTASVKLYAHWSVNTYVVTFNGNGGSNSTKNVSYGSQIGTLPSPSREGYSFKGWYTATSGGTKISASTTVTDNVTYYAQWNALVYTVAFDSQGGTACATQNVAYGGHPTFNLPTRSGYSFKGWYTAASGGTKVDGNYTVKSSVTLYAQWNRIVYTITYDAKGGSISYKTQSVNAGDPIGSFPTASKDGYDFAGWYNEKTTRVYTSYVPTASETLTAHWNDKVYTVAFDSQGGESYANQNVKHGEHPNLPKPSKKGYNFKGWYTTKTGGSPIGSEYTVKGNVTLYAQWERIVWTITFDPNGGTVSQTSKTVNYGDSIKEFPSVSKEGYTLAGWYNSKGTRVYTDYVPGSSETLKAQWNDKVFTVVLDSQGGGDFATLNVKNGEHPNLPLPKKSGYTFNGWYTDKIGGTKVDSNYTITANQTLYAQYSRAKFTVKFDANGGDSAQFVNGITKTVTFGEPYGELPNPSGGSLIFIYWTTASGQPVNADTIVEIAQDHTLYATWYDEKLKVKVSFDANGGYGQNYLDDCTKEVTYGDVYGKLPAAPSAPQGMVFTGWYTDATKGSVVNADTKVGKITDHKLYAHWRTNKPLNDHYIFVTSDMGGLDYYPYYDEMYKRLFIKGTGEYDANNNEILGLENLYGAKPNIITAEEAKGIYNRSMIQANAFGLTVAGENLKLYSQGISKRSKIYFYNHSKGVDCIKHDATEVFGASAMTDKVFATNTANVFSAAFDIINEGDSFVIASAPQYESCFSYLKDLGSTVVSGAATAVTDPFLFAGINSCETSELLSISYINGEYKVRYKWYLSDYYDWDKSIDVYLFTVSPQELYNLHLSGCGLGKNYLNIYRRDVEFAFTASGDRTEDLQRAIEIAKGDSMDYADIKYYKYNWADGSVDTLLGSESGLPTTTMPTGIFEFPNVTPLPTGTPIPTAPPTQAPTNTPVTAVPTNTPATPAPSNTPAPSDTPSPSNSQTPSNGPTTPAPSDTPTPSNVPTTQVPSEASVTPEFTDVSATQEPSDARATQVPSDNGTPYLAEKNTVLKTSKTLNAIYVVSKAGNADGRTGKVSFKGTIKDKTNVTINSNVTIKGVKYSVTGISSKAFQNNKKLKKITIGSNVEKVGKNAFAGCKNLKTIVIKSTKLTASKVDASAFKSIGKNAVITVPKKSLKQYKSMFKKLGVKAKIKAQ